MQAAAQAVIDVLAARTAQPLIGDAERAETAETQVFLS